MRASKRNLSKLEVHQTIDITGSDNAEMPSMCLGNSLPGFYQDAYQGPIQAHRYMHNNIFQYLCPSILRGIVCAKKVLCYAMLCAVLPPCPIYP